jgi:flagellar basal-body rod modification protein FlgD
MDVASVAASSAGAGAAKKAALNYDSFLRLLVAQMKNQDPTEPKDTTQYLSQLAAFSAVEQGVSTNQKLDALMSSIQLNQSVSFIGQKVTGVDGTVTGIIKSVSIGSAGLVATLEDGQTLALGPGITISKP